MEAKALDELALTVRWPSAGAYIVAVSGGADSMVLLDLVAGAAPSRGYTLTVGHFDHGLRPTSAADASFVEAAAARYGLNFQQHQAQLVRASEAKARAARHAWLEQVRVAAGARAILTAHHQDDLLETSLLNLARGSGRLGLAPMQTPGVILRPLINVPRQQLRAYAAATDVTWREDATNADIANPRNLVRHELLAVATPDWRAAYLESLAELTILNTKIDQSVSAMLEAARTDDQTYSFAAAALRALSAAMIQELLAMGARSLRPGIALDRRLLAEAATFVHTGRSGKFRPLRQGLVIRIAGARVNLTTNAPA